MFVSYIHMHYEPKYQLNSACLYQNVLQEDERLYIRL